MAEAVQCPNCGKFYPAFIRRVPLYRSTSGKISEGGQGCWRGLVTLGCMALIVGAFCWAFNTFFFAVFVPLLVNSLLIGGAILAVPGTLMLAFLGARPAGYRYICKSCGKRWEKLPV